ncbi:hypothetical protein EYC84_009532 [Monilinia fructicola]|uniref:Uncharacterized protein n=1 Tax=Monilinia fructicola TaxID=38448 RepID=A0A5M9J854_MONFR|nr:hypothetical protein EYC84_009532 [Monilinia fructicola]
MKSPIPRRDPLAQLPLSPFPSIQHKTSLTEDTLSAPQLSIFPPLAHTLRYQHPTTLINHTVYERLVSRCQARTLVSASKVNNQATDSRATSYRMKSQRFKIWCLGIEIGDLFMYPCHQIHLSLTRGVRILRSHGDVHQSPRTSLDIATSLPNAEPRIRRSNRPTQKTSRTDLLLCIPISTLPSSILKHFQFYVRRDHPHPRSLFANPSSTS